MKILRCPVLLSSWGILRHTTAAALLLLTVAPARSDAQSVVSENDSWRLLRYSALVPSTINHRAQSFDQRLVREDKHTREQSLVFQRTSTGGISGLLSEDGIVMIPSTREFYFPGRAEPSRIGRIRFSASCPKILQRTPPGFHIERGWFCKDLFIYEGTVNEIGGPTDPARPCLGYMRIDLAGKTVLENRVVLFWRAKNPSSVKVRGNQVFGEKRRIYWRNQGAGGTARLQAPEQFRDSRWHCYDLDRETVEALDHRAADSSLLETLQRVESK